MHLECTMISKCSLLERCMSVVLSVLAQEMDKTLSFFWPHFSTSGLSPSFPFPLRIIFRKAFFIETIVCLKVSSVHVQFCNYSYEISNMPVISPAGDLGRRRKCSCYSQLDHFYNRMSVPKLFTEYFRESYERASTAPRNLSVHSSKAQDIVVKTLILIELIWIRSFIIYALTRIKSL